MDVAVVPDISQHNENRFMADNKFFVVANRNTWLGMFQDEISAD